MVANDVGYVFCNIVRGGRGRSRWKKKRREGEEVREGGGDRFAYVKAGIVVYNQSTRALIQDAIKFVIQYHVR